MKIEDNYNGTHSVYYDGVNIGHIETRDSEPYYIPTSQNNHTIEILELILEHLKTHVNNG